MDIASVSSSAVAALRGTNTQIAESLIRSTNDLVASEVTTLFASLGIGQNVDTTA